MSKLHYLIETHPFFSAFFFCVLVVGFLYVRYADKCKL